MINEFGELVSSHDGKKIHKWSTYFNIWNSIFSPYKNDPVTIFEIGIQNGGSLEVWSKYFKNAKRIIGCDIDPKCGQLYFEDPRISVVVGDVNSDDVISQIKNLSDKIDILIDDGSHISTDIIKSFGNYFPLISNQGIYVIEDLHASYWKEYQGGLFDPNSAISFLKKLIDVINYEHWHNDKHLTDLISSYNLTISEEELRLIHSANFFNSLCIIKKQENQNTLGKSLVFGNYEDVFEGLGKKHGMTAQEMFDFPQVDSYKDIFELLADEALMKKEIARKDEEITQKDKEIASKVAENGNLRNQIEVFKTETENLKSILNKAIIDYSLIVSELEHEILKYELSKSWKITRPLRKLFNKLKGK